MVYANMYKIHRGSTLTHKHLIVLGHRTHDNYFCQLSRLLFVRSALTHATVVGEALYVSAESKNRPRETCQR